MKNFPYDGNPNDRENLIYSDFEAHADAFVRDTLGSYTPQHYSRSKVIHDCVWGSVMFYPWELQIMDSPLLQRLRRINQLGLAMYTYPSAHHSRFEHTLGVVAVAEKMMSSIKSGVWGDPNDSFTICSEHSYMIRMAALLHDVGHCFFSHLSEGIYSETEQFRELKDSFLIFRKAQAHEILGYIIINTPTFVNFFREHTNYPYKGRTRSSTELLLKNIGRIIVGAHTEPYTDNENNTVLPYYLTEIINGQFDADALDYLKRDSYATGLDLTYNLDRFLYKIRIVEKQEMSDGKPLIGFHLTIPTSGVSTVEEMMYNKQMLTRYIYQHQKVMTLESIVCDIAHGLIRSGKLSHPCDFLYFTDDSIYMLEDRGDGFTLALAKTKVDDKTEKTISELVQKISSRDLPKKALVINSQTVCAINGNRNCTAQDIAEFIREHKHCLRLEIYREAQLINQKYCNGKFNFDMYDIHIAVPKYSLAKDYSAVYVLSGDNNFVPISEVMNLNGLADTYADFSWNAYVFADSSILAPVSLAAIHVLEKSGAKFHKSALSHLKHYDSILALETKNTHGDNI